MGTIRLLLTITIFLLFLGSPTAHGQTHPTTPIAAPLCDLFNKPAEFDHKFIQTTGEVHFAFEEFLIVDSRCPDAWPWVWLYYGDRARTTPFAAIRNLPSTPGIDFVNDDQMKSFKKLIALRRDHRPDGSTCYDRECNLYKVTATITGHFFAVEKFFNNGAIPNGYGHMGCCHALVIERVTDLHAQRTPVPSDGVFFCKKKKWEISERRAVELFPEQHCKDQAACTQSDLAWFRTVRTHWQDHVSIGIGSLVLSDSNKETWYSADLLLSYQIDQRDKKNRPLAITREVCQPLK